MLVFVAGVVTVVLLLYKYWNRNENYWKQRGVPTPDNSSWFFGHFKDMMLGTQHLTEITKDVYYKYPEATAVGLLNMSRPVVLARDPDFIKAMFTTDFQSFSANAMTIFPGDVKKDKLLSNNPFALINDQWKTTRGHVSPALTYVKLKGYVPAMIKVANEMVKYINKCCGEKESVELPVKEVLEMYTSDVLGEAICGIENNTFVNSNSYFRHLTKNLISQDMLTWKFQVLSWFPWLASVIPFRLTSQTAEDILVDLCRKVIKDRTTNGTSRPDVFQQIITLRENDHQGKITDLYAASMVFTLSVDLHETSSLILIYIAVDLANHPEVQDKLREEIGHLRSKGDLNIDAIEGFKYLHMVMCETMRVQNPIHTMFKECTKDYKPAGCSFTITKGTHVITPVSCLHKDPQYFPNPDTYDPEHFSDDAVSERHKFAFLPFGEGPRKCLGNRVAQLLMKVALINLVENFHLKPSPKNSYPLPIVPNIQMFRYPAEEVHVVFEKIK